MSDPKAPPDEAVTPVDLPASPTSQCSSAPSHPGASETLRPTYAAAFRCIGPACEDTCCRGWAIPLDERTYKAYQQFPEEDLGTLVSQYVSITTGGQVPNSRFAQITMTPSGFCPFFDADRLCSIQREYGGQLLSTTCSVYPRALNKVTGVLEGSLILSCPQAARDVLLTPDLLAVTGELCTGTFRTDYVISLGSGGNRSGRKPYGFFYPVRDLLVSMVKDRSRPIWQRLLLIGSVCKRLDEVSQGEGEEAISGILEDHRQVVEQGLLRDELARWPGALEVRLKVILKLSEERARDKTSGKRFQEMFWSFVEGIGSSEESAAGSDLQRFLEAEDRYYRKFFETRPFILENFLLNYIFQNLFPFGRENSIRSIPRSIFAEYIVMTTQYAWIDTLLVGVAGHYKEAFSEEHVVYVIQSFCRAVEHNGHVLNSLNELMTHLRMDNLQGMAAMLKSR